MGDLSFISHRLRKVLKRKRHKRDKRQKRTPTARKQGKYLYDPTERASTIDTFDVEEKIDENAELFADIMDLLLNKITWYDLIHKKPKRLHMIASIRIAHAMLFFELYGYPYNDFYPNNRLQPHKSSISRTTQLPSPEPPQKPTLPKIELVPLPNNTED